MFSCRVPLRDLRIVAHEVSGPVFAVRRVKTPAGVAQPLAQMRDPFARA